MIVQPDFLRHWKTRKLVAMTGDQASPLFLIRLWGHCQTSRQWEFPGLKRDDLAAICEWECLRVPKLSCEKALVACGWIEKIKGGGYRVRRWDYWNKNLVTNWLRNPSGKPRDDSDDDPTGTPRAPRRLPDKPDQPDKPDKPDQINPTNPTNQAPAASDVAGHLTQLRASVGSGKGGLEENSKDLVLDGGLDGLALSLARKLTQRCGVPTLEEVRNYLRLSFDGAVHYAEAFYKAMEKQHWLDRNREPITDWHALARSYASKACLKRAKT